MALIDRLKPMFTAHIDADANVTLLGDHIQIETVIEEGDRRVTRTLNVTFVSGLPKADDPVWLSLREVVR